MVDVVNFDEAKQPHARKRRDAKAKAIKDAFAASRSDGAVKPMNKPNKKRKKPKKK
tara:strand:+ start:33856 stop:34023 length:168 start_codon:yes stop_codon:yes gene_type:complete